ncbi:MAG: PrgI family protein [Patescibacteria group bacterium]
MKKFQVPQFIEIESRIFGPLTLKQFIYLIGGAGIIFILYKFLPFWLMIFFSIPVGGIAVALAFYKVNNQPFIRVLESAFHYTTSSKIYIWKKQQIEKKPEAKRETKLPEHRQMYIPKITKNKLKDLAWSLDIKENR